MKLKAFFSVAAALSMTSAMGAFLMVAPGTAMAQTTTVTIPEPATSSLDPAEWGPQQLLDAGTLLEGLVGFNPQGKIEKKVAASWTATDQRMVWTFHLRHNARWSNGKPVTAQDFYYAWMRLAWPQDSTGALWSGAMGQVVNAWAYHGGAVKASQVGLKVINAYTLQMHLVAPLDILPFLTTSSSMPLYPPSVKAHPTTWYLPKYFVGNGPYVVSSFTTNGEIKMTRNRDYVGAPGEYNVGNIQQINVIPTPNVPVEDYMGHSLSTALITSASDYIYAKTHLKSQLHKAPAEAINYLEWDKSVDPSPLNNQMVRAAIAMAINRKPIATKAESGLVGATTIPAIPGWPPAKYEHNPYAYNVVKARKLLAKAGYPNGRGMPTLYLYCDTVAGNPQYVPMAEAVAAELKQNLNLNFKIQTLNPTVWGQLSNQGMQKGILPGYNIASGGANWAGTDPGSFPLSINQWVTEWASGAIGPEAYRQHAEQWYFYSYDPQEVKAWGNPNNAQEGVKFSQWQPLIAAAKKAIPVIMAFWKKQPKDFFDNNSGLGPGSIPLDVTLKTFIASYKTAKTPAEKHAAWVSFWKWVGTYPTSPGNASLGLADQAYVMTHEPKLQYDIWSWTGVLWSASGQQALKDAAKISNAIMASGYVVPLNYEENVYLVRKGLTGVDPNPNIGAFGNFYNLQYLRLK